MEATLISYRAKDLSKTEASKLSKGLLGYKDKSNRGRYTYNRMGLIKTIKCIIVSKSTFIVPRKNTKDILSYIKTRNGNVSSWDIIIPDKYFKKSEQRATQLLQKRQKWFKNESIDKCPLIGYKP